MTPSSDCVKCISPTLIVRYVSQSFLFLAQATLLRTATNVLFFSQRFQRKCTTVTEASLCSSVQRDRSTFSVHSDVSVQSSRSFRVSEIERREQVSHHTTSFLKFPKVEGRPKGPLRFFSTLCDFVPKIFEFYPRVHP